ncbi:hypothetical protein [Arenimonas oryziterrae]|nr:hypothetical protein [Arenimonas oryziterrae]
MRATTALLLLSLLAPAAYGVSWSQAEYAGTLTDPDLDEVSGLAASRAHPGLYWAVNDSGNPARLVLLKPDGTRVASYSTVGAENTDWEDIDSFELDGKRYLLVADTGDNGGIRTDLSLLVFEEPRTIKDGGEMPLAWKIEFRWPDGARDCEASAVDPVNGDVLLISKKRVPPELFRLPLRPSTGVQVAEKIATLPGIAQPSEQELEKNPVYGRYRSQISGADLSPNGRVLAVMNYHSIYFYIRAPGQSWPAATQRPPSQLRFPWLPQAEAIAFSTDGSTLLIGSEQRPTPLLRFRVVSK